MVHIEIIPTNGLDEQIEKVFTEVYQQGFKFHSVILSNETKTIFLFEQIEIQYLDDLEPNLSDEDIAIMQRYSEIEDLLEELRQMKYDIGVKPVPDDLVKVVNLLDKLFSA